MDSPATTPAVAVAVPIRSFDGAKSRLSTVLSPEDRAATARRWAGIVLDAAGTHARVVVTDDADVGTWAQERGATVVSPGRTGLDAAADAALRSAGREGFDVVVIAHGDLPLARSFEEVVPRHGEIVLVPDRFRDGTNVIALPVDVSFDFSYGPGSFERHLTAAARAGGVIRTVEGTGLSFDVDDPGDLEDLP